VSRQAAAIVLAGGFSSRMRQLKTLLPLGKTTVTDHIISTFLKVHVDIFLVVGYRRYDIIKGIKNKNIKIIYNPDYKHGMFSSVQAGIRCLQPMHRAFFILPVDIPLVRPATIRRLIDTAGENPGRIIYPVFRGKRGHPPLIPSGLIPVILGWEKSGGLKAVLKSQEKLALEIKVPDSTILFDIDTPDDYTALLKRYQHYEVPTDEECDVILNDVCKVAPERIRHCRKVARVAVAIGKALDAAGHKVDIEIIRTAAVLHDITKGQRKHDITGGEILRELGFGKAGDVVAVHSTLADGDLSQPLEAKAVYLADKLVAGEKLVSIEERYYHPDFAPEVQAKVLERREVARNVKRELEELIGRPLESVITANYYRNNSVKS
jgi:molybdenum cofactor cytidylyltransferase